MWNWIKQFFSKKKKYKLNDPYFIGCDPIDGTEPKSKGFSYTQKGGVITFRGSIPEYELAVNTFRNSPFNKANHKQLSLLEELEAIKQRKHLKYNEALALTIAIKSLKEEQESEKRNP